jgi:hypothetical protein
LAVSVEECDAQNFIDEIILGGCDTVTFEVEERLWVCLQVWADWLMGGLFRGLTGSTESLGWVGRGDTSTSTVFREDHTGGVDAVHQGGDAKGGAFDGPPVDMEYQTSVVCSGFDDEAFEICCLVVCWLRSRHNGKFLADPFQESTFQLRLKSDTQGHRVMEAGDGCGCVQVHRVLAPEAEVSAFARVRSHRTVAELQDCVQEVVAVGQVRRVVLEGEVEFEEITIAGELEEVDVFASQKCPEAAVSLHSRSFCLFQDPCVEVFHSFGSFRWRQGDAAERGALPIFHFNVFFLLLHL